MPESPTLMQVRRENDLTSRQLADAAGIPLREEYLAEIGGLVDEEDALKILEALCHLTSKHYTRKNVQINIRKRQPV